MTVTPGEQQVAAGRRMMVGGVWRSKLWQEQPWGQAVAATFLSGKKSPHVRLSAHGRSHMLLEGGREVVVAWREREGGRWWLRKREGGREGSERDHFWWLGHLTLWHELIFGGVDPWCWGGPGPGPWLLA